MRRATIAITALGAVVAAAAAVASAPAATKSPSASPGTIRITEAAGAVFPERAFVLGLPAGMKLTASQVRVLEDGRPVKDVTVTAAGVANRKQFGIVLAIDASESMKGEAITSALGAARQFVTHRNPNQQVAVVLFNKMVTVRQPFTTSVLAIQRALAKPPQLLYGTRIYDAVDAGISMLERAEISAGSVIVLSDGADLGSTATLAKTLEKARDTHTRVFTVGLRSRFFDPKALQRLAAGAGGVSAEAATPKELGTIYDALGSQLAREYLVRYKSFAAPGRPVEVSITVNGFAKPATSGYVTPKLALPAIITKPYHESAGHKVWTAPLTMVVIALIAAGLIALLILSVVRQFPRSAVRSRIGEFVSLPGAGQSRRPSAALTTRVLDETERALGGTDWWMRFKRDLEIAQISMPASQIVVLTAVATLAALWLLSTISGTVLLGLIAFAIPFGVRAFLRFKLDRVRRLFGEQLAENLQVLASALRAGHSFIGAMAVVVEDAAEPTRAEFRRVVADEQLGVPVEEGLRVVANRMESRELEQVGLVAALQRQTGGNTAEVLDRVNETLRERQELRRTIRTLTAQGRLSRWIVSALPIGLLLFISLTNPEYVSVLYTSTAGRVMLVFAGLMIISGSLVIKKIIDIKV